MDRKHLVLYGGIALAGLLVLLLPVTNDRIINRGTDAFEAHHALYGPRIKSQEVTLKGKLTHVGAILVNLRHVENLSPVTVAVHSAQDELLEEQVIPPERIVDDAFAWVELSQVPASAKKIRVDFAAPKATNDTAVGLRFDREGDGHIAIAVQEQVPLWWQLQHFLLNTDRGQIILRALAGAALLVAIILLPQLPLPAHLKANVHRYVLALLFLITVAVRFDVLQNLRGVSGGDPYNYLSITKQLTELKNPFAVDKRLPGWPLLMVPAYVTDIDDIWWMRSLSVLSAGGIIIVLSLLARSLKLPWSVQVAAPALLAFQKDFFLTSLRPEPYTFYTLLLLLALLCFQYIDRRWVQIALGMILGYAAMTRQEGFVLAVVLGACTLPLWKKLWWQGYLRIGLPAFLLVLPFFVHNTIAFGNPIYTPYFEGGRNDIVDSWPAFQDAAGATWGIISALWRTIWDRQFRVPLTEPLFRAGFIFVLAWWGLSTRQVRSRLPNQAIARWGITILSLAVLGATLWRMEQHSLVFGDSMMMLSAGALLASIVPFLAYIKWRGVPIVLVLITQTLIALWFHPFPKHYQQDLPLFMLLLATALFAPLRSWEKQAGESDEQVHAALLPASTYYLAMLTPFIITTLLLFRSIVTVVDESNHQTAVDYVIYEAVKTAQELPGPHGFDNDYQQARLYFAGNGRYYGNDLSSNQRQRWIEKHGIRTMVLTNVEPRRMMPDESWQEVFYKRSEGKNERRLESWVYQIPNE